MELFELLNFYGVGSFESVEEEVGHQPSLEEYLDVAKKRAELFFTKREGRPLKLSDGRKALFYWNEKLESAVVKRSKRMYISQMVERKLEQDIKTHYPELLVGSHPDLDMVAGIDIAVGNPETERIVYLHVAKNTLSSLGALEKKKVRPGYKNGRRYERSFDNSHIVVEYGVFTFDYDRGLIPRIKLSYLEEIVKQVDSKGAYLWEPKEILRLDEWLTSDGSPGLGRMFSNEQTV